MLVRDNVQFNLEELVMSKTLEGTVKWFNDAKGYGFLTQKEGEKDLFVHLRSVQPEDRRRLRENTRVRFSVENTEKGPQAENIRII